MFAFNFLCSAFHPCTLTKTFDCQQSLVHITIILNHLHGRKIPVECLKPVHPVQGNCVSQPIGFDLAILVCSWHFYFYKQSSVTIKPFQNMSRPLGHDPNVGLKTVLKCVVKETTTKSKKFIFISCRILYK